jgi:hypothetical protein
VAERSAPVKRRDSILVVVVGADLMKLYEPLCVPKPVDRDLWTVDGPLMEMKTAWGSVPFPTRAGVVRLADGRLWVWSPVVLTDETRSNLAPLGPVRHLVSPNKIHYAHIAAWKAAYPDALAWASPGVRERAASHRVDVTFDRDLVAAPDTAWATVIDQLVVHGSRFMDEVIFFHRASRTLIVADLIENFEPAKLTTARERLLMKFGGVSDPDGKASSGYRATFLGRHRVARQSIERVLAWNPERILIAHGRSYEKDGTAELRRAFRWLGIDGAASAPGPR